MSDLKEDLRIVAEAAEQELKDATAIEALEWTARTFGDSYIVASNMQDAVLIDLAAKVKPNFDVLFLQTGYHFPETIGVRDASAERWAAARMRSSSPFMANAVTATTGMDRRSSSSFSHLVTSSPETSGSWISMRIKSGR